MGEDSKKMNINWFPGHMSKSLREIESNLKLVDIIIEIVDARAPMASRNPEIIKYNKPRLLILSKKDLADEVGVKKWLEYFKDDKEILKGKSMLLQTVSSQLELNIDDYRVRQALFR